METVTCQSCISSEFWIEFFSWIFQNHGFSCMQSKYIMCLKIIMCQCCVLFIGSKAWSIEKNFTLDMLHVNMVSRLWSSLNEILTLDRSWVWLYATRICLAFKISHVISCLVQGMVYWNRNFTLWYETKTYELVVFSRFLRDVMPCFIFFDLLLAQD